MEQKEFTFDEATPLQEFIDRYRDRVVGHVLKAVYTELGMFVRRDGASQPVFLVLDDSVIGVDYLYQGHVSIFTADETDFEFREESDEHGCKDFSFRSSIFGRDDAYGSWCVDMPAMDQKVTDISIGRHSNRYEDYPNSERPEGGDYFSWLKLTLEDGTELYIYAEDSIHDGYVDVWMYNFPAYPLIKAELDRTPHEIGMRIHQEFKDVVAACEPTPDELAELAMYYMRKCDHEIEKYREENWNQMHGYNTLYTDLLHDVIEAFADRGMNSQYTDATGKRLRDLILEIGDEASNRVLPLIYTEQYLRQYADFLDRRVAHELELVRGGATWKELSVIYDSLPKEVQETDYGQKVKEIQKNWRFVLESHLEAIREFIKPLH